MTCIILKLCIFFIGDVYFQNKINSLMSLDLIWSPDCNILNKNGIAIVKISHEKLEVRQKVVACVLIYLLIYSMFCRDLTMLLMLK